MIPVFPVSMAFGASHFRLVKGQTDANRERLEKSSQVVTETITNIRTVAGLGAEDIFVHKYTSYYQELSSKALILYTLNVLPALCFTHAGKA